MDEYQCSLKQDPVCPHCGHIYQDAWELNIDDCESGYVDCGECGREFRVTKMVFVKYSTAPAGGWPRQEEVES